MRPLTINEAIAIVLYWQNAVPGTRDEKIFAAAWGVVCQYAEPAIRARKD